MKSKWYFARMCYLPPDPNACSPDSLQKARVFGEIQGYSSHVYESKVIQSQRCLVNADVC
jgi:hypothetical protein